MNINEARQIGYDKLDIPKALFEKGLENAGNIEEMKRKKLEKENK